MRAMFKIAIVEDDPKCTEALKSLLIQYEADRDKKFDVAVFNNVENFLNAYKCGYDIVFMDIDLPGMNGMVGAHRLREIDTAVTLIFVTNMAQFAVQGYEVGAFDYILKPVIYKEFCVKLDRALGIISRRTDKCVVVFGKEKANKINIGDILFVEVRGHHLYIHTTDGEEIDSCGSLTELSDNLAGNGFSRCNDCYLINMRYIKRIGVNTVTMIDGTELLISRRKRKNFMNEFTEFMGSFESHGGGCNE